MFFLYIKSTFFLYYYIQIIIKIKKLKQNLENFNFISNLMFYSSNIILKLAY